VSEVRIKATTRTEFGKGASRRLRRDGQVPAVVYGHGTDPLHVALPGHELARALREANVLLELQTDAGAQLTLPKSVQRNPVRYDIEHVDLVVVVRGEKVTVDVPLAIDGSAEPGSLLEHADTVSVAVEATHIPESIMVSVAGLPIGSSVTAGELTLPEGVELAADPDVVVIHVIAPVATEAEAPAEEAVAAEPTEA
jgi:large subunit ribosomal protein L25